MRERPISKRSEGLDFLRRLTKPPGYFECNSQIHWAVLPAIGQKWYFAIGRDWPELGDIQTVHEHSQIMWD